MLYTTFNERRYVDRAARGELTAKKRSSHWPTPGAHEPPGTVSQFVLYLDGGTLVAMAHRYLRPDGTIGASGNHDPKWVLDGSEILVPSHDTGASCPDCAAWRPRARASSPRRGQRRR